MIFLGGGVIFWGDFLVGCGFCLYIFVLLVKELPDLEAIGRRERSERSPKAND